MFFLARYCKLLEENSFRGRTADFFYMLLFGATVLTGIVLIGGMIPYVSESFAKIIFLSNSLTFMMVSFCRSSNFFVSFLLFCCFLTYFHPLLVSIYRYMFGANKIPSSTWAFWVSLPSRLLIFHGLETEFYLLCMLSLNQCLLGFLWFRSFLTLVSSLMYMPPDGIVYLSGGLRLKEEQNCMCR